MIKSVIFVALFSVLYAQNFDLNILHYNDFHARFQETSPSGGVCVETDECLGGFARLATAVREAVQREPDSILLNAGDSFQGTIWYNLLRYNVTFEFMNLIKHDAHVLGNHEFDNGIAGVVPYLKNLDSVVVTANMIDDDEPTIQGLYKKTHIIEKNNRKIGIIGIIISSTNELASTGRLRFTDEIEAAKREAQILHDQGVDIIIVLSHSGIQTDMEIGRLAGPHIDIVVGGHSHSLLYTGEPPENSAFTPVGPYPTIVQNTEGREVLIVQAAAHTQFLGEIKLTFDPEGHLVNYVGHPHFLHHDIEQAQDVLDKINEYLPIIDEMAKVEVGSSLVHLSRSCACDECNLGNLMCDAYMDHTLELAEGNEWNAAHFCIMNQGSIRQDIPQGVITFESLLLASPFENNVEIFELRGDHIMEALEYAVANVPFPGARMLQFSGIQAVYDGTQPVGNRVVSAKIRCIECDVPRYEDLETDKYYKVVTQSFIAEGGDGFTMISQNRKNIQVVGVDYALFQAYVEKISPVISDKDGRIQITSPCAT